MQSIEIRGPIDGMTEEQTVRALADMDRAAPLLLRLNSDGGSVQAGVGIFNALRGWPGGLTVEISGWALSIASLILMAGDVRRIHPTGAVMVHAPWTRAEGSADELRQRADALDTVAASMRAGYLATGQKPEVIELWLSGPDFWFTADQALAAGLVTEVIVADPSRVTEDFANASACKHSIPETLKRTIMAQHQQNPVNEESIRAQALAADRQRRADIRARFSRWQNRDGVHALLQSCEDDPQCTPQAAGHRLLDLLGSGTTPIQAAAGWSYTGHDDRLSDFRAAAVDTLLMRGEIGRAHV